MFGLEIIEVGIGLVFMYLMISLICSGIVEAIVKVTKLRAKHLKTALGRLLSDPNYNGFVKELYEHHMVKSPLEDKIGEPTYIDSKVFANAVFDILSAGEESDQFKAIESKINTIKDPKVKTRLLKILHSSADQVDSMRDKVEHWFNHSMESVSDWYKKRMRTLVSVCGIVLVTAFNADTIQVAKSLWTDNELREATLTAAQNYSNNISARMADVPADTAALTFGKTLRQIESDIEQTKVLPVGWNAKVLPYERVDGKLQAKEGEDPILFWLIKIAGLLMTMGAVSLGAPYWYAMLRSLLNLRFGATGGKQTGGSQPITVNVNTNSEANAEKKEESTHPPAGNPGAVG